MLIAYNNNGDIVGIWRGDEPLAFYMPEMSGRYNELILSEDDATYQNWFSYKVVTGQLVLK